MKKGGPKKTAAPQEETKDEEFTCQFCNQYSPTFSPETLDMHYWKDCPMLSSCPACGQVVEIPSLNDHLMSECDYA
jgi:centrosomal protein CEP104